MTEHRSPPPRGTTSDAARGPLSAAEQRAFFGRPLLARLATVAPDGAPYIAVLWFEWDEADGSFWFVIRERAGFMPHLVAEPRVCLSIASESPPYARATIMGRAEIVGRPGESDAWRPIADRMARAYIGARGPGYVDSTAHLPRWLVRVVPQAMTTWRGGGWARRYTEGGG
jgi:PPOX class probable F420-dependent enzyme